MLAQPAAVPRREATLTGDVFPVAAALSFEIYHERVKLGVFHAEELSLSSDDIVTWISQGSHVLRFQGLSYLARQPDDDSPLLA